jgi:UPF0755 protein
MPMKRLLFGSGAVLLLVCAFAAWRFSAWVDAPLPVTSETVFDVAPGSAFTTVSRNLQEAGILDNPRAFSWYGRLTGDAANIRAGEYLIGPGVTPAVLLDTLVRGDVRQYSFTIVEGWTYRELLRAIAGHEALEVTTAYEDWPGVLEALEAEFDSPEGLFLPETYRFPRGTTDVDLLKQAYSLMQSALAEEWEGRASGLPLATPYEALTLASIIEKETALAAERPLIAGVFVRRLEKRMRLQTDPTVIFGLGESFDGNLTRSHLRTDTPYNTYTRRGLPPGPIALPGRAAINAALNPAPGETLYFVATGLGDGSHKFSVTNAEHEAAVAEYLNRQRSKRRNEGAQ